MKIFFLLLSCMFISFSSSDSYSCPFFQKTHQPYHISVGAVLFNQEGRLATLHRKTEAGPVYTLMRESMEDEESVFATLKRGLQEEMGATAKPIAFLGALTGMIHETDLSFEKTTLYIVCQLTDWDVSKRNPDDYEMSSQIEWIDPDTLISIMSKQGKMCNQVDRDESKIIERALPYLYQLLEKPSSD